MVIKCNPSSGMWVY